MTTNTPQDALERTKAAIDAAKTATEAAEKYADQLSVSLARGGEAMLGVSIDPFVFRLMIFVLAILVGYYVVWSVTPALHTPLMSVTNAISSVIIVGALTAAGVSAANTDGHTFTKLFGFIAVVLASINIFGGFLVTERMLAMYKKKPTEKSAGEKTT